MNNVVRLRQARSGLMRVQRRIWILQALFWPVVILGSLVIATTGARLAWRRYTAATVADDAALRSSDRADGTQPASNNGDSPGETGGF
jgi:hypothetical protein